ncbi:hypothetical protein JK635_07390 [Neobacillus sp. YIM B02564]|uniref:Phosphohydrolase n=1 Tax=Neobacillus paridis TaxID=2803862 RepID=A0ABS1TL93_9BACI|nr:hypothetical protein [Neobacillus paridis]MBL4952032.1 hypothetical protein [Neobacillus paridis]
MTQVQEKYRTPFDYMATLSGKNIYPLNPRSEEVDVQDMIHALSQLCRYGGHAAFFYSVLHHSLLVERYLKDKGASPLVRFYGLWHDGTEAYLVDLPRPVKRNLSEYVAIEDRLHQVIWEALGVRPPTEEEWELVKEADNAILYYEAKFVQPTGVWWRELHQDLGYEIKEELPSLLRKKFLTMHLHLKNRMGRH